MHRMLVLVREHVWEMEEGRVSCYTPCYADETVTDPRFGQVGRCGCCEQWRCELWLVWLSLIYCELA